MSDPLPDTDRQELEVWLRREFRFAATAMLKSISAEHLTRRREALAQTITPKPGSIVASPGFADYDPEPDYFFHWLRDSALVMDAVREVMGAGLVDFDGHRVFADFVRFSLELRQIDVRSALAGTSGVAPHARRYLRPPTDILSTQGERLLSDARFNPDGTLDILKWARPQLDGPALRALTLMRYWAISPPKEVGPELHELIHQDLAFVRCHADEASFDIWEEELGHHYYTRLVQLGALYHGGNWLRLNGSADEARACTKRARELRALLDNHWCPARGIYLTCMDRDTIRHNRDPDISIVLGVLHAALPHGTHSVLDSRVAATLASLEDLFSDCFEINKHFQRCLPPALGRYPGDRYFDGGAYYISTLAAAEFCFHVAQKIASHAQILNPEFSARFLDRASDPFIRAADADVLRHAPDHRGIAQALMAYGDGFLATVRKFTPATGELSEQFDRNTGNQRSARNLAWSYAAFIMAYRARQRANCLFA